MFALRMTGFAGTVPRLNKRMLAPRQARVAMNCILTGGDLRALNAPRAVVATLVENALSVFRMEKDGGDLWLSWDRDVDVARGPVAADTEQRIYWTGDGEPRCSNYAGASSGLGPFPGTKYVLGVFAPTAAPGVAYSGTTGTAVSRAFVYTFVNAWGEESAPSPASSVVSGGTSGSGQWDLTSLETAPANTFSVSGAAWSSGVATLTVASTRGLRVGEEVSVSGITPAGYDTDRAEITALTSTTISYAVSSNPGAYSAGGTITREASHNTSTWKQRFYWTETTASGTTYVLAQLSGGAWEQNAASTATILGNAPTAEGLPSAEWEMPPTDMHSIGVLPNGIMYGASKNDLCLSEPGKPYAWPTRYRQTADFEIVAVASFGTTIVVGTKGTPYTLSGVDPTTMNGGMNQIKEAWPCLSKRGMVELGAFGVSYPAPQGLVLIGVGGASIATRDLYTQREWSEVSPDTIVAAVRDGKYHFVHLPTSGTGAIGVVDKSEFASLFGANYYPEELWTDPLSGLMYMVLGGVLYEYDADSGQRDLYDWMSREEVLPTPINLGAAKVDADFSMTEAEIAAAQAAYDAAVAANQALINSGETFGALGDTELGELWLCGDELSDIPPLLFESLQFNLYINDALVFTKELTNTMAFRLPAGYKADNFAVRISGNVAVSAVVVAETMTGLRRA